MNNDVISICNVCGTRYRELTIGDCLSCCIGEVKKYDKSGAAIVEIINRAGYTVKDYTIPDDTALRREIRLDIIGTNSSLDFDPPKGFTCNVVVETPTNENGDRPPAVMLNKHYSSDMPDWKYALELAHDRVLLIEWVYNLPLVKNLIES